MKVLALMWVAILMITPLACVGMTFLGIWTDFRWLITALAVGFLWIIALGGTLAALHEDAREPEDLDVPSWMSEN